MAGTRSVSALSSEKTVYNAPFGVLVTLHDGVKVTDPRIVTVSLPSLLLLR
jgi:hypothetical protein